MKRVAGVVVVLMLLVPSAVFAAAMGLSWYNIADNYVYDHTGTAEGDKLPLGNPGTSAPFLQLIWVGADGEIDEPWRNTDGTGEFNPALYDDVVVDVAFFNSLKFTTGNGQYDEASTFWSSGTDPGTIVSGESDVGKELYVRAWELPSPDYDHTTGSTVPGGVAHTAEWYGDSETYTLTGDVSQTWKAPDWQTDMQSIPEPGSLALFGLGLAIMAVRRRLRK